MQKQAKMPKMAQEMQTNFEKLCAKTKNKHCCEKLALTASQAPQHFSYLSQNNKIIHSLCINSSVNVINYEEVHYLPVMVML